MDNRFWDNRFWAALFWTAAFYNFLAGLPPLLAPTLSVAAAGMPPLDPQHVIIAQMMGLMICVFGIGYAMVAMGSPAARPIVLLGIVGKAGVCLLVALRLREVDLPASMLAATAGDLLFVVAFIFFLSRPSRTPAAV